MFVILLIFLSHSMHSLVHRCVLTSVCDTELWTHWRCNWCWFYITLLSLHALLQGRSDSVHSI